MEERHIREVLAHCSGKLTGTDSATSLLDIHYTTLRSHMRRMGLLDEDGGVEAREKKGAQGQARALT